MKRRRRARDLPARAPAGAAKRSAPGAAARAADRERRSPGSPLDEALRRRMESLLGHDLEGVRVHADAHAAGAAAEVGARAYTRGRDIYFGRAAYAPESTEGLRRIAHELAHVAQTGGRAGPRPEGVEPQASPVERAAESAADAAAAGRHAALTPASTVAPVLREAEGGDEDAAPVLSRHPFDVTPAHGSGVIPVGSGSVTFRYIVGQGDGETVLVLEVSAGLQATFTPLGETAARDLRVDDPGGDAARTVRVHVPAGSETVPRVRALFTGDSASHMVVFQFPG